MLAPGSQAPAFSLPDQDGKTVALDDLRGQWVVLYFYPRDDTPGCTVEACEFTAAGGRLARLGATVLGCSADSAAAHKKFIAKHALGIRLLVDADRAVMRAYGAYGEKKLYGKPVIGVIRSTVLIDPQGRVAHHWSTVRAAGHAEQVAQRLAELQGGAPAASGSATETKAGKKKTTTKKAATKKAPVKKATGRPAAKKANAKKTAKKTASKTAKKTAAPTPARSKRGAGRKKAAPAKARTAKKAARR